jgi:hypothetical protein
MILSQGLGPHAFGPEMQNLCGLFQSKSPLATKHVADLCLLVGAHSSVQATIPFSMIPSMHKICMKVSDIPRWVSEYHSGGRKLLLVGSQGQPIVREICDSLAESFTSSASSDALETQIRFVLDWLAYLGSIVTNSIPSPEMLARILGHVECPSTASTRAR